MANIDVTELLTDPDFVDDITIVRRTSAVNDDGINVITETQLKAVASVQSGDNDLVNRLPDGIRVSDTITIYTKTEIITSKTGGYPDIVIWNNQRHQVIGVTPWGNYGKGWYRADCVMEKPNA
jgi:hypothetical protein